MTSVGNDIPKHLRLNRPELKAAVKKQDIERFADYIRMFHDPVSCTWKDMAVEYENLATRQMLLKWVFLGVGVVSGGIIGCLIGLLF